MLFKLNELTFNYHVLKINIIFIQFIINKLFIIKKKFRFIRKKLFIFRSKKLNNRLF